jgi:hypothetical protein
MVFYRIYQSSKHEKNLVSININLVSKNSSKRTNLVRNGY